MAHFGKTAEISLFDRIDQKVLVILLWLLSTVVVVAYIVFRSFLSGTEPVTSSMVQEVLQKPVPVLIAKEPIVPGTRLKADLFSSEKRLMDGDVSLLIGDPAELEGYFTQRAIARNEILSKDSITRSLPANALTAKIPEGYRAVTISVNAESGVEGWVRPGVRVDVVWISTYRNKQVISTIVEDALVLSAEQSTDSTINDGIKSLPQHVTLMASATDAQKIQLAKTSGILSLNLRGSDDQVQQGSNTITVDGLLGSERAEETGIDSTGWIEYRGNRFEVTTQGNLRLSD